MEILRKLSWMSIELLLILLKEKINNKLQGLLLKINIKMKDNTKIRENSKNIQENSKHIQGNRKNIREITKNRKDILRKSLTLNIRKTTINKIKDMRKRVINSTMKDINHKKDNTNNMIIEINIRMIEEEDIRNKNMGSTRTITNTKSMIEMLIMINKMKK